jgi:hypothetical protein
MVGHNPGLEQLVDMLTGEEHTPSDCDVRTELSKGKGSAARDKMKCLIYKCQCKSFVPDRKYYRSTKK